MELLSLLADAGGFVAYVLLTAWLVQSLIGTMSGIIARQGEMIEKLVDEIRSGRG